MEFIQNNWLQILIIAIISIVFLLLLAWQIKKKGLRQTIIDFIVEAEEKFRQGENSEKFTYVYNLVYTRLPVVLQLLISEDMVKKLIQKIFDEVKTALDCKGNTTRERGIKNLCLF